MSNRVVLEPIFILHSRPYSNTSLIIECLTMRYGRVVMLARSARGLKSRYQGKLQCFIPILASWSGARELKNLGNVELCSAPYQFGSKVLMCGFYLNELLMRLLHRDDPCPDVFTLYQMTLNGLEKASALQQVLRCFEKRLLDHLGYGLSLTHESETGQPIVADCYYQYYPDYGFVQTVQDNANASIFCGRSLLDFSQESFLSDASLKDAKRLMRIAMSLRIGSRPLKSRELMV
jgi:DNA repair protein RecO (recombination protein O)